MGRLYRLHADGNWYGDYDLPGGERVRKSLGTRDKAVAKERLRQAELAATPGARGRRQALSTALDEVVKRQRVEGTRGMYITKSRALVAWMGDVDVGDISIDTIEAYITTRLDPAEAAEGGGVGSHTVKKELIVLKKALELAHRRGVLPVMPAFPEHSANYVAKDVWLTHEEFDRVIARLAPKRQRWMALATLAGGRDSEVEGLDWGDLGPEMLHIRGTKTKTSNRYVPVAPALRAWLEQVPTEDRDGPMVEPWISVRRDLHVACKQAEITKRISPNDLRRTFASWLVQENVPILTIARLMGHASTKMVESVYARLRQENLVAAIDAVPAFQLAAGDPAAAIAPRGVLELAAEVTFSPRAKLWGAKVRLADRELGTGFAHAKQEARQRAVAAALRTLASDLETGVWRELVRITIETAPSVPRGTQRSHPGGLPEVPQGVGPAIGHISEGVEPATGGYPQGRIPILVESSVTPSVTTQLPKEDPDAKQ